ncbi:DNA modification methylase [Weissella paramesenteroides]|uniref:DNA modification methylase n=1 Tax=Weissella paramesenteroides TaxID=1249 RepID=UPI00123889C1|nr:DNA modification methylase [Weissella paramesenteroides]KAA8455642.1 DNA modification methylase [Weissella paramesenteroides]KAA8459602.1 DNA modification methylase [Weissella paramesenteroides]KAA8461047.1 DNA modification methylase [Weissella paramesenteroides]KAA8462210.1 DNA modification methylase [Weissella paramesenteroides]KAA8465279.1 DNA modification methylase [Weissella paramesenteroides]
MDIKQIPITDVVPYDKNPRNNDDAVESTANSIKEFGWQQPIVVDKNNIIIVGHTRLKAAEKLKLETVPVLVAENLSEEQVKAYRLADNKTGELADWDMALLNEELEGIAELDMDDFGFELAEDSEEVVDDDFDVEVPDEPTSKLGQIYQLGNHRLMVGDSTDTKQVEALMSGQKADLLLTDPPYNVAYTGKTKEAMTIQNDHQEADEFYDFLFKVFNAAKDNMKMGASFYVWYASAEVVNFVSSLNASGMEVREELIWRKNSMVLGRQDYQWQHEPCLYGWNEGASHAWYSDRKQTTILNFDRPTASKLHPTMKPVPLFDYQIKNSSKQGDLVLDLFGGSGTTMIACEQNGRHAYLMELDPKYADVIITRWEEFTGKKAELVQE